MNRKQFWLTAILSSFTMAFFMSGVLTAINTGLDIDFVDRWVRSFCIAWPIALLLNLTLLPKARALAMIAAAGE